MTYIRSDTEVIVRNLITHEEHSLASSTSVALSPDGRWLIYLSGAGSGKSLMIVSSDGAERYQVANFGVSCVTPQWSPAGDQLAFVCDSGGNVEIYVAHSACGFLPVCEPTLRQITHSVQSEGTPTWSPDGQWIAYSRQTDNSLPQVYATHVLTGETRRLTYVATSSYAPRWTMLNSP